MSAMLNFDQQEYFNYDHKPLPINLPYMEIIQQLPKANNCSIKLGQGSYGSVYQISDTDKVLKICATSDLCRDGYHSFLKLILSEQNPFFPKIDKFIKYRAIKNEYTDKVIVYAVRMERLYGLMDTPQNVLKSIAEDIINDFTTYDYYKPDADVICPLVMCIKKAYTTECFDRIKNRDLVEALMSIRKVHTSNNHYNDMGMSNFMIRQTLDWNTLSVKYHLVITDPLS
jgi:hypothetical protein